MLQKNNLLSFGSNVHENSSTEVNFLVLFQLNPVLLSVVLMVIRPVFFPFKHHLVRFMQDVQMRIMTSFGAQQIKSFQENQESGETVGQIAKLKQQVTANEFQVRILMLKD